MEQISGKYMKQQSKVVTNAEKLSAVKKDESHITVEGKIRKLSMITLHPRQVLTGETLHLGARGS